jgi:hypothetical protein
MAEKGFVNMEERLKLREDKYGKLDLVHLFRRHGVDIFAPRAESFFGGSRKASLALHYGEPIDDGS